MTPAGFIGWLEFWLLDDARPWSFLFWANGHAVSTGQFAIRTALVALSLFGAVGPQILSERGN